MTRRPNRERRQRAVVDGRTVAEIRTECVHSPEHCSHYDMGDRCCECGKVRRVPIGRDAQPVRCGGTEET